MIKLEAIHIEEVRGIRRMDINVDRSTYAISGPNGSGKSEIIDAIEFQAKRLGGFSAESRRLLRFAIEAADRKIADRSRKHIETRPDHNASCAVNDHLVPGATGFAGSSPEAASTATGSTRREGASPKSRDVRPGARLLREWNGRTHVVEVIEGGYVFESKLYPSLSAIARLITGAHWSGPRFFGLVRR